MLLCRVQSASCQISKPAVVGVCMKGRRLNRISSICVYLSRCAGVLLTVFFMAQVCAQTQNPPSNPAAANLPGSNKRPETALPQKNLPPDVRVVIDVSGSMKQNDPNNLRQPALDLLIKLLPEGSKAGVWTFGRYVNMLVPHKPVADRWREQALSKVADVRSTGLFTNIGEALEKAAYDSEQSGGQYRPSLILLTDGMVDISKNPAENQQEWRRIVDQVLPRFQQSGYTIHTIALSDNADTELLNKLAVATDGIAAVANSADDLMKIFLQAFDKAVPAEQVPLDENTFVVDSSIEEFTALIFRQEGSDPTRLIGPDQAVLQAGLETDYLTWYSAQDYDLITVKQPLEGLWQVQADLQPDSRVTVVSDLNLVVRPLPNNLFLGNPLNLSLALQEDGKTVTQADFLSLLDIQGRVVQQATGASVWNARLSSDSVPDDGLYHADIVAFDREGNYTLSVKVDGKTFKREFSHGVSVREPFAVDLKQETRAGMVSYLLTVSPFNQTIDLKKTQVAASIRDPRGRSSIKPLRLTETDNWRLNLTPVNEGEYLILVRVNAVDRDAGKFEFRAQPVRFTYPDDHDPFATAQTESVVEQDTDVEQDTKVEQPVSDNTGTELQEAAEVSEPEPESVQENSEDAVPEADLEDAGSDEEAAKWPLYVGLGVGNLIIMVLAFFAYRMIMGNKELDGLEELEAMGAEEPGSQAGEGEAQTGEPSSSEDIEAKMLEDDFIEPEPMDTPSLDSLNSDADEMMVDTDVEGMEVESMNLDDMGADDMDADNTDVTSMDASLDMDDLDVDTDLSEEELSEADAELAQSLIDQDLDLSAEEADQLEQELSAELNAQTESDDTENGGIDDFSLDAFESDESDNDEKTNG